MATKKCGCTAKRFCSMHRGAAYRRQADKHSRPHPDKPGYRIMATEKDFETGWDKPAPVICPVGPQFGAHGGVQWRAPRYYFLCGCDAGYCENHAKPRVGDPMGPKFEPGLPRKCRKHAVSTKVEA